MDKIFIFYKVKCYVCINGSFKFVWCYSINFSRPLTDAFFAFHWKSYLCKWAENPEKEKNDFSLQKKLNNSVNATRYVNLTCKWIFYLFIHIKKFLVLTWGCVYWFEREEKMEINQLPPVHALIGDRTHNLSMCPDWESTHIFLVYGTMLQPTDPPWPGLQVNFF